MIASKEVVEPTAKHSATVILLHGLGDNGKSWKPLATQMKMPWCKFIFPSAAPRPVTINMGAMCPAWADIKGLTPDAQEDDQGTLATQQIIHNLISQEVAAGIDSKRIVIGGFSQGAAMTCVAALTHEQLGGCFMLSGWLPLREKLPQLINPSSKNTPIFQAHGKGDQIVPFSFGQMSSMAMKGMGYNVDFREYNIGHESSAQEISDLKEFLHKCIGEVSTPTAPIPSNYEELSAKELKSILKDRNVDASDCFEKCDLVAKVKSLL